MSEYSERLKSLGDVKALGEKLNPIPQYCMDFSLVPKKLLSLARAVTVQEGKVTVMDI